MINARTPGFALGMGVFFTLMSIFLCTVLVVGERFPEWAVAVGAAAVVTVSVLVGLAPMRVSRASQADGSESIIGTLEPIGTDPAITGEPREEKTRHQGASQ